MRSALVRGLGLWLLVASCAKVADPEPDKNINWLRQCSDDRACGSGLSCECGRCTTACDVAADCGHRALGYACEPVSGDALREQCTDDQEDRTEAICVARCKQDSDCPKGTGLSCRDGLCVSDQSSDAGMTMTMSDPGTRDTGMDGGSHKPPMKGDASQPPVTAEPPFWDEDAGFGGPCNTPYITQTLWFGTCACTACRLECLDTFGEVNSCTADFDKAYVSSQCHACLMQAASNTCLREALQCADPMRCDVSGPPPATSATCVRGGGLANSGPKSECESEFHSCSDGKDRLYQCQLTGTRFECNCYEGHSCVGRFSVPATQPNITFCEAADALAPLCGFKVGGISTQL